MKYELSDISNFAKTKKLKLAFAGVAFLALLTSIMALNGRAGAVVGGPACNVPADYLTIQAAVDVPTCSTIKVGAATYPESVTISRPVVLKGAKAGVDVSWRTFWGAGESTVDGATPGAPAFIINAPDVTIDGFSVTNPSEGIGITVKTAGNNAVIKNNIINGIGGPGFLNHTVGVYLELGPDNVKISGNKISNVQSANTVSPGTAQGILVGDSTSGNPSLGIRIEDNKISDISSLARGAYGIQLNNGASAAPSATGYTTAKVLGNSINNLSGGWAHAIGLEGDTPNIVVKYNTISNITDVNPTPINDAIGVFFQSNVFFFTADVNRNSLYVGSNAYGIAVDPVLTTLYSTLSADGTCNWWGNKNGPGLVAAGSGSLVSVGVDYKPWLKSSSLKAKCGDKGHGDYNDNKYGHGHDDKDRWHWDD